MEYRATSLTDDLLKAMKAERDGHSFYLMAANSTGDAKGRMVFENLAREELEHLQYLKEHYDSIVKTGRLSDSAKLGTKSDLSGMSPIFSEALKRRIKEAHIEMSALSIGVQLELEAMNYYRSLAQSTPDTLAKKFYAELAEWESGHYQALIRQQELLKEDYWSEAGFSPF